MKNLLKRAALVACALLCATFYAISAPAVAGVVPFANGTPYTTGILSATSGAGSESNYAIPVRGQGFNVTLSGVGVGTVVLERSFDKGVTWSGIYAAGVQFYSWTYSGTPISEITVEPENNVYYRLRATSLTSGSINYRISQ
ncbi:hypothetical protein [Caulobacter segnis]|uniref:Uncharacterized protein n=1 Tax=Caulobacter segnis TaxID=88688 RepID=A0A2W5VF61_9CAUL|nr:hypothetical protein [Caulobacter segnis]PZR36503.1 MAG: hypothetical protein DI526_03440 [Caulobacter segnis]